jgi:predicted esterase
MTTVDLGFRHRFLPGSSELPPLLLLHGTGGNEDDLVPLGEALLPGAPRLSPRGQVLENGMPRFFRRLAEGVFDMEDLRMRTHQLADFVASASEAYQLRQRPVAVGLSNGANIAAAMLLLRPETLAGALLFRPMVPLEPDQLPDLGGVPVQINAGRADPLISAKQTEALAQLLTRAGAKVSLEWVAGGHGLTRADLETGARWLRSVFLLFRPTPEDRIGKSQGA